MELDNLFSNNEYNPDGYIVRTYYEFENDQVGSQLGTSMTGNLYQWTGYDGSEVHLINTSFFDPFGETIAVEGIEIRADDGTLNGHGSLSRTDIVNRYDGDGTTVSLGWLAISEEFPWIEALFDPSYLSVKVETMSSSHQSSLDGTVHEYESKNVRDIDNYYLGGKTTDSNTNNGETTYYGLGQVEIDPTPVVTGNTCLLYTSPSPRDS